MASKKKLGKGLSAIFGEDIDTFLDDISNGSSDVKTSGKTEIDIDKIRANPYQPRKQFDEKALKELSDSIKENGVFQPILIRQSISGYELVAGERRLRAAKLAGLKKIPAIIVEFDDRQMMEISLLENIQRENLTPIEEAKAYDQLIKKLKYTQEELSKHLGKSRANIANMLRLLSLPGEVQELVNEGKLSYGQARTLLSLDDEESMIELAERTVKEGLSVRELESITAVNKQKKPEKKKKTAKRDPFTEDVVNRLQKKFATKVEIKNKSIIIRYTDTEDLNRLLDIMNVIED